MKMNRQSGFSLLEIMVAAALLGGLALAGAKLMESQSKSQKTVESRSEINAVLSDIRTILSQEQSCGVTFGGKNVDLAEGTVTAISQQEFYTPPSPATPIVTRYDSNTNAQLAKIYGNGNVRILGYRLTTAPDTSNSSIGVWSALPSGNRSGATNLIIRFYIGQDRTQGVEELSRKIALNVEINPSNQIVKCSAVGGMGADAGRYIHRQNPDPAYRTMNGDLIMADGFEILFLSDSSLKYDIKSKKDLMHKLKKLRPVTYKWKSNHEEVNGLIAQEVQEIFPELVQENTSTGKLTVSYVQLTPLLLKGIQELDQENQRLKENQQKMDRDIRMLKKFLCETKNQPSFCIKE